MIRAFRNFADTFFGRAVLFLIAASMLLGFVGLTNFFVVSNSKAISVKDKSFSGNDVMFVFQKEVDKMRRIMPGGFSYKEAMQYGILRKTIDSMIYDAVIEAVAKDNMLVISDDVFQDYVRSTPEFWDERRQFKRDIYLQVLRNSGLNEREFVAKAKNDLLEAYVMDSARTFVIAPEAMLFLYNKYASSSRDALIAYIDVADMKIPSPATEEELKEFYEENKMDYMTPEYRDISVAQITYEEILKSIKISDEELGAIFEEERENLSDPETRHIYGIVFGADEEALAEEAVSELKAKKDFKKVAQNKNPESAEDYDWNYVAKASLLEELSDPVFSANKGDVVGPIEADGNFYVIKVMDIKPFKEATLKEKKDTLERVLRREQANRLIADMTMNIEDDVAAGLSVEEIAKKYGLNKSVHKKVKIDDKSVNDIILNQVFVLEEKEISSVMDMNGGLFIAEAQAVYEPEAKDFDKIKDAVQKAWENSQKEHMAVETIAAVSAKLNAKDVENKELLSHIARRMGLKTKSVSNVTLDGQSEDLTRNEVSQLFDLRTGEAFINSAGQGSYKVVSLVRINLDAVPVDDVKKSHIKTVLEDNIIKTLEQQLYMNYLKEYNVKIDEKVISNTFGNLLKTSEDYTD